MSHRSKKTHCVAAGALSALVLVAVGCQTSSSPTAPGATAPAVSASVDGGVAMSNLEAAMTLAVDICHRTEGDNPFILVRLDDHAVPGHVEHGDGYPGGTVPGQSGNVFGTDCQVITALVCPCWADATEAQLVELLSPEFGVQQADCATFGSDVYARGVNGNSTEISAIQTDMSCTLRTSTINVSMTSLPASVFGVCLAQARQVVPQLSACHD